MRKRGSGTGKKGEKRGGKGETNKYQRNMESPFLSTSVHLSISPVSNGDWRDREMDRCRQKRRQNVRVRGRQKQVRGRKGEAERERDRNMQRQRQKQRENQKQIKRQKHADQKSRLVLNKNQIKCRTRGV